VNPYNVLILEGIHALNPLAEDETGLLFKVYVSP
jgi:uridine kinase